MLSVTIESIQVDESLRAATVSGRLPFTCISITSKSYLLNDTFIYYIYSSEFIILNQSLPHDLLSYGPSTGWWLTSQGFYVLSE